MIDAIELEGAEALIVNEDARENYQEQEREDVEGGMFESTVRILQSKGYDGLHQMDDDVTGFIHNVDNSERDQSPVFGAIHDGAVWIINNFTPLGSIDNSMATMKSPNASVLDKVEAAGGMILVEDRHGKSSTIITSQIPVNKWHEVIGEETIADAILDRIIHDAHRIEMKGDSLRKKRQPKNQEEIELINLKN